VIVEEREYARLLGYPWGTRLEGDVRERAAQAIEWYECHCKPRVYCVSPAETTYTVTAITAGHEVDEEVDRLWNAGRVDEAYFLDRYAAAVVEKLAQDLGPYQSPGTGRLPFGEQWKLFSYIAPLNPEIEILPSGMLKPKNSILAIVRAGIKPAATGRMQREPRSRGLYARVPCTQCDLAGCSFRRVTA
jgi:hypothetical protein